MLRDGHSKRAFTLIELLVVIAILAILAGVASLFFWLEKCTGWKLFNFIPPLLFIYIIPAVFSNTGVTTNESPVYGWMSSVVLPLLRSVARALAAFAGSISSIPSQCQVTAHS